MHIIVPMSGLGQRFVDQGYKDPKPLIKIEGMPIIEHVANLFPGESKFTFICNRDHLENTEMRSILENLRPGCNIVDIDPHKKGPVYAVSQIYNLIDDDEEVIVNYCDFGTYWDYGDFLKHTRERKAEGAVICYRDFHPHMMGSTNYAFLREKDQWMLEIKEKEPFTDNRMEEFASNGTYYFRSGALVKKYFTELMEKDHNLNGEFYVSLIYNLLVEDKLPVSIYKIQHMLQWGTPADVEEYLGWSQYFRHVMEQPKAPKPEAGSVNLIPLAGRGSRFQKEGYADPKPLISVAGKPMIVQAAASMPASEKQVFVCLQDHLDRYPLAAAIQAEYPQAQLVAIDGVTEGQAITCDLGLNDIDDEAPLLIAACDNGMLYDQEKYQSLLADKSIDAIVWTFRDHPSAANNPQMYGWVKTEGTRATGVSVKQAISDNPRQDHAIVGTFYFRKAAYFRQALEKMLADNIRVNNEYYVDSMVGLLADMGLRVEVFEVDDYICWGTPNDYRTYCYWQSFFHKTNTHPYDVRKDTTCAVDAAEALAKSFSDFVQEHR